jgi:hypothetical protein
MGAHRWDEGRPYGGGFGMDWGRTLFFCTKCGVGRTEDRNAKEPPIGGVAGPYSVWDGVSECLSEDATPVIEGVPEKGASADCVFCGAIDQLALIEPRLVVAGVFAVGVAIGKSQGAHPELCAPCEKLLEMLVGLHNERVGT